MNSITAFLKTSTVMVGKVLNVLWVVALFASLAVVAAILNIWMNSFNNMEPPSIFLPILISFLIHFSLYSFGKKILKEHKWQKLIDSQK